MTCSRLSLTVPSWPVTERPGMALSTARPGLARQQSLNLRHGFGRARGAELAPHHDGIYFRDGYVVHLTGLPGGAKGDARIRIDPLTVLAAGRPVTVRRYAGEPRPGRDHYRALSKARG
jgi:hypothetical protein